MSMPQWWIDRIAEYIPDVTAARNRARQLKQRRTTILTELAKARKERQAILKKQKDADVSAQDARVIQLGKEWSQTETDLAALQKEVFLLIPRYAAIVAVYEREKKPRLEATTRDALRKAETLKNELNRTYAAIRRQRRTDK